VATPDCRKSAHTRRAGAVVAFLMIVFRRQLHKVTTCRQIRHADHYLSMSTSAFVCFEHQMSAFG
jgi:hypothetical protein